MERTMVNPPNNKQKPLPSSNKPKSMVSQIEQIARLIRIHIKPQESIKKWKKRSTTIYSSQDQELSPANNIEQIAKLLRSQTSKIEKFKKKNLPFNIQGE